MLLRLSPPLIDLWAAVTMLEQEANGTSSHRIASHHIIEQCKEQLALDRWLTPKSLIHVRQNHSSDRPVPVYAAAVDARMAGRSAHGQGFEFCLSKNFGHSRNHRISRNFTKFRPKFIFRLFLKIFLKIFKLLFPEFLNFGEGRNHRISRKFAKNLPKFLTLPMVTQPKSP